MSEVFNVLSNEEKEECLSNMSRYQRKVFDKLENDSEYAKDYNLNDLMFDFDRDFVDLILNLELKDYLKNNKDGNRKNGYIKGVNVVMGGREFSFNRPRLRKENDFDSKLIPKRKRFIDDISENVILLYSKNNSVNDIKEILDKMFDIKISTAVISELTQGIMDKVIEWRNRELDKCYFTINIDCTYITIRDNKNLVGHKIPVYIAIGTRLDGHKEIVGMYLGNEDENKNVIDSLYKEDIAESKSYWVTVFNDLKDRGVERVFYIISDGLSGMDNAVKEEFPDTKYQRCVVHLVRNLKKLTTKKDCKEVIGDFKKIYTASGKEVAIEEYNNFKNKYRKKRTLLKHVEEYVTYIMPLYDDPKNIRKYIYTNNIVESANSKVKRGFYGRGALPNVESALNIIYLNLNDLESKWKKSKVNNWDNIFSELITLYGNDIKKYMEIKE